MKIRDLTPLQRTKWLRWAIQHDWAGEGAYIQGHGEGMRVVVMGHGEAHEFDSIRALKNWAGY